MHIQKSLPNTPKKEGCSNLTLLVLVICSSMLLSIPFLVPGMGMVSLIAFLPLLLAEHLATESKKRHFWIFYYLCFVLWNLFTTYWIYLATLPGAIAAILLNALQMAVIFRLFRWMRRLSGGFLPYLFLIIAWIAWEHAYFTWDVSWPWLVLGNSFAQSVKSVQWYEYTGTLGGSLWILLVNTLLFRILVIKSSGGRIAKSAVSLFLLFIIPVIISHIIFHTYEEEPSESRRFALIQPNIDPYNDKFAGLSQTQQNEILLNLCDSVYAAGKEAPDFILAPETFISPRSAGLLVENNPLANKSFVLFRDYAVKHYVNMIIGAVTDTCYMPAASFKGEISDRPTETARYSGLYWYDRSNTAIFYDTKGNYDFYHKSKLVVLVESTPYKRLFRLMSKFSIDLGGSMGSFAPQKEREVFVTEDSVKIGTAICYESVYGDFYREYVLKGAEVMSVITNDGWWGNTPGYRQHLSYASLRAIETRRSIARCANTGISAFINQRGEIISSTGWWKEDYLVSELPLNKKITVFVQYGDIVGRVSCFLFFLFILMAIVRSRSLYLINKG